jgi:hypothetical protein
MSDVVRHQDARSCTDRCGEDRDILRISKIARQFKVMRGRALDLDGDCAEELLEERDGFRELGGQIPSNLSYSALREHQAKEAKLAEHQDRVASARARQQSGDQDISIDADG